MVVNIPFSDTPKNTNLFIYLSIYLPTYLPIYLSAYIIYIYTYIYILVYVCVYLLVAPIWWKRAFSPARNPKSGRVLESFLSPPTVFCKGGLGEWGWCINVLGLCVLTHICGMLRWKHWHSRRTVSGCGPEEKMLLHCKLRRAFSSEWSVALYPHISYYIPMMVYFVPHERSQDLRGFSARIPGLGSL